MKKIIYTFSAIFMSCCLINLSEVQAAANKPALESKAGSKEYLCSLISRGEAIKQANRKVKGKVVGVQLSERGSRSVYKVRMLVKQKRVKTISINACK